MTEPPDAFARETMESWALGQVGPWLLTAPPSIGIRPEFERLNAANSSIFVLTVSHGGAVVLEKPASGRDGVYVPHLARADRYCRWFAEAARDLSPDFETTLAINVRDYTLPDPRVPIFSFQKPIGNKSMLLPDIDLLNQDFKTPPDGIEYSRKVCRAVFAGSTTGRDPDAPVRPFGVDDVLRDGAIPRVRAALHFRGDPNVSFLLPNVVQTDSPKVAELLRTMNIGVGQPPIPWAKQLESKFILSMDGNGATCSRLAVALASNSVLVKYDSDNLLYYFQGLRPWQHFIPVSRHEQVTEVVEREREYPGLFAKISEAGRRFHSAFLVREAAKYYTARLLTLYSELLAPRFV